MTSALPLKAAMQEMLADWQDDLPPAWAELLGGIGLGFADMDASLSLHPWEPIFPARRGFPLPGAPEGAHLLRAFDGLQPETVRCLLIGQDPYPSLSFCTGRAFESGEHRDWRELEKMRSCSMRCLLQCIYACRSGEPRFAASTDCWQQAIAAIEQAGPSFPKPSELAGEWVDQGVLLLNSSLTLSRFQKEGDPHQLRGHLPLWRPLMARLIRHFLSLQQQTVVGILFGKAAQEAAAAAGVLGESPISEHPRLVAAPHPAEGDAFLSQPNPFLACNQKLKAAGAEPINW